MMNNIHILLEKIEQYFEARHQAAGQWQFLEQPVASLQKEQFLINEGTYEKEILDTMEQEKLVTTTTKTEEWEKAISLPVLYEKIHTCMNCSLGETRTKFVFGVGNPKADLMVIGEAPGADEDKQGEPFVGRAGQLLNKILTAIEFSREEVYIANIIKCRPPNNRRPETEEVVQCEPYLFKQVDLIKPKVILALGLTAVNTLLRANYKMANIRGKVLMFRGIQMIATYHPAALLRNPGWKRNAWEDVQVLRKLYDEAQSGAK